MGNFSNFDFESFLKSGAIFSPKGSKVVLCWGKPIHYAARKDKQLMFYTPDFYLETKKPWMTYPHHIEISRNDLRFFLENKSSQSFHVTWKNPQKDDFEDDFNLIQSEIREHHWDKAVPIVFEEGHCKTESKFRSHAINNLLKVSNNVMIYGKWNRNQGILGGTPEVLCIKTKSKNSVFTVALAGTLPLNNKNSKYTFKDNEQKLLHDPKELHEHRIVIRGIQQAFKDYGKVNVSSTHLLKFSNLIHLETHIRIKLHEEMSAEQLVRLLHPTPALGISHRKAGIQSLKRLHCQENRGEFGAPFGLAWPDGSFHCVVAIRNIQWRGSKIYLGSGCGIVKKSLLDKEWKELQAKRQSVKNLMGLN